ncbi:PAS and ANTAR domain-containing protein [Nocardia africana]|uniref:histidine kinase n=1 Tax=Nocardia africana TaxID=134964 RepID=A0A378X4P9_9NOCA|nr:PAS and ANTAR domain-containing protein [Nocardia africana]MCC3316803.1 PAS and ANTAR domain-containing protein [Nocardia africana]SUA47523.1 putative diguanylate cyclase [Nocardia africana]
MGGDNGIGEIEQVLAAGHTQGIGWFRFWFDDQRWEWSDEVARLHGYGPDEVEPTTELLLSHKHPDDRDQVEAAIVTSVHDHAPFSSRHRIIDTHGTTREVIVVSEPILDPQQNVVGTRGYYIDLTPDSDQQARRLLDETLPELIEHRAVIEQAKGVLMLVYSITAEQAFKVLAWRSQETNTKLRDLAAMLVEGLHTLPELPARHLTAFDHLLLTTPQPPTDPPS